MPNFDLFDKLSKGRAPVINGHLILLFMNNRYLYVYKTGNRIAHESKVCKKSPSCL